MDTATVPAQPPGLSTVTGMRPEATVNPAARAVPAQAPSAATTVAVRPRVIRHAEAPVSEPRMAVAERVAAVVVERMAAVVGVIDRRAIDRRIIDRQVESSKIEVSSGSLSV